VGSQRQRAFWLPRQVRLVSCKSHPRPFGWAGTRYDRWRGSNMAEKADVKIDT
jgi:hypothetical protein